MKEIDARGLACPAPVLQTKAALAEDSLNAVRVTVDNEAAQQNVKRFLESQGFKNTLAKEGDDYYIIGKRRAAPQPQPAEAFQAETEKNKIMVMCCTDRMGFGDDELGLKLMVNYIRTLKEMGSELWRLVFLN
ncbi:MAG: sulfurtransferase-like selenium metabolism protein YedF, partial [Deltaproteobacteria bacterium]